MNTWSGTQCVGGGGVLPHMSGPHGLFGEAVFFLIEPVLVDSLMGVFFWPFCKGIVRFSTGVQYGVWMGYYFRSMLLVIQNSVFQEQITFSF